MATRACSTCWCWMLLALCRMLMALLMHLSGDTGGDADALFGTNATVQHRANAQADDVGTSPVVSGDPLQRKYAAWAAVLLAAC